MRPTEKIEKLIKKFEVDINPQKDREKLDKLLQAQSQSSRPEPGISYFNWRIIMKSPIIKLSAIAVMIMAVLIGAHQIADRRSPDAPSTQDESHNTCSRRLGEPGVDELVARASLIVRGKYLERIATKRQGQHRREDTWTIEVSRVLYGNVPSDILTVIDSGPATQESDPTCGESILFLEPYNGHWRILSGYTPHADLDSVEKDILVAIETGR